MRSHERSPTVDAVHAPGLITLRVTGCDVLDELSAPEVTAQLPDLAGRDVVLDLAAVRYASSAGLGALVSLRRRALAAGHRFAVANVSPAVREALAITRLDTLIEVLPDAQPCRRQPA